NTLAERMQYFPHFETRLHARFPELNLVVRNQGWSADEVTRTPEGGPLRPRSQDVDDNRTTLNDHNPDAILALFGVNESFVGKDGLAKFESDLEKFIHETTATKFNGESTPKLVLVSPIPHEDLKSRFLPNGAEN